MELPSPITAHTGRFKSANCMPIAAGIAQPIPPDAKPDRNNGLCKPAFCAFAKWLLDLHERLRHSQVGSLPALSHPVWINGSFLFGR